MFTKIEIRPGYGWLVIGAVIALGVLAQQPQSASGAPAPAGSAAYAEDGTDPARAPDPSAPEGLDLRTVETLSRVCQAGNEEQMWCGAYLIGVADTMTVFGKGGHKAGICGVNYDVERLRQVFTSWVQQHPEFLDLDMLAGVSFAFREIWPC